MADSVNSMDAKTTARPNQSTKSAAPISHPAIDKYKWGSQRQFDLASWIGLFGAFLMVITAICWGGTLKSFVDISAFLIVVCGTCLTTTMCFSVQELRDSRHSFSKVLFFHKKDLKEVAMLMVSLSDIARKQGLLALDQKLEVFKKEPLLHKGISMVVDGANAQTVRLILNQEIGTISHGQIKGVEVLRKGAEFAPSMGLIGTLIGLVQMLGNLTDPSVIGPSMAIALLTTFYGAVLANLVFIPMSAKLERNSHEETIVNQLYAIGAESIAKQENPRQLEMRYNSILPKESRITYFDA